MLRAEKLRFDYEYEGETPVTVLSGLDLAVEKGSFVALLGHNGCGKSTLAKLFNAIRLPTGGRMLVLDRDTADEANTLTIRRTVGLVLQDPDNQLVSTVVEEDVAFGPENLGVPPEEIARRVTEALAVVGMEAYRRHAPHKLSGGQKQRVAIAGILAMQPECIVLDEPTAMLDPQGRRDVMDTIKRLNREGITIVLITHHMPEAAEAQRVIVMEEGRIAADGTPKEVFSQVELLRQVGLSVPDTTALLYALNQSGYHFPLDALSVEECAQALAQSDLLEA